MSCVRVAFACGWLWVVHHSLQPAVTPTEAVQPPKPPAPPLLLLLRPPQSIAARGARPTPGSCKPEGGAGRAVLARNHHVCARGCAVIGSLDREGWLLPRGRGWEGGTSLPIIRDYTPTQSERPHVTDDHGAETQPCGRLPGRLV